MAALVLNASLLLTHVLLRVPPSDPLAEARNSIVSEDFEDLEAFFASDELRGRDTPSPELDRAADYLEMRFEEFGLEPWGNAPSYRQSVEFPIHVSPAGSVVMDWQRGIEHGSWEPETSCVLWRPRQDLRLGNISLTAWAWDGTAPPAPAEDAAILLSWPSAAGEPWQEVVFALGRQGWEAVILTMSDRDLLESAQEWSARPRIASERAPRLPATLLTTSPSLSEWPPSSKGQLQLSVPAWKVENGSSDNVGALLRGRDPELAKQILVVSAHYDHVGMGWGPGDQIFNGADDNASGTSAVLELAEAFSQLEEAPRRSVLFLTFCGEEKGLLGSREFVENPTLPLSSVVANVNIEMIGRPGDNDSGRGWVTGDQFSDVAEILNAGCESTGFEFIHNGMWSDRLFFASDNFPLAQHGIPAHSVSGGSMHDDYHQPTDEADRLDYEHMQEVVQALFLGLYEMAERPEPPRWNLNDPQAKQFASRRASSGSR